MICARDGERRPGFLATRGILMEYPDIPPFLVIVEELRPTVYGPWPEGKEIAVVCQRFRQRKRTYNGIIGVPYKGIIGLAICVLKCACTIVTKILPRIVVNFAGYTDRVEERRNLLFCVIRRSGITDVVTIKLEMFHKSLQRVKDDVTFILDYHT